MSECSIGETLAELLPRTAVEEIITTYGDGYSALLRLKMLSGEIHMAWGLME